MLLFLTSQVNQMIADRMATEASRRKVASLRLYTETFPQEIFITVEPSAKQLQGSIQLADREVSIQAITSIWSYLPGDVRADPELDTISAQLVQQESREALKGFYRALADRRWVNSPSSERAAGHKIYQLRLAAHIGMRTPRTRITNDPAQALEFLHSCKGAMLYKPISYLLLSDDDGNPSHITYATLITPDSIEEHVDSIRLSPCMFQERIPKKCDLTIYAIGKSVWATAIHRQEDTLADAAQVDYRAEGLWNHRYIPFLLPPAIEQMCVRMTSQMGLRMCNFDMILTPDGDFVFLDANPTDLWAAIEDLVGFPLCAAIIDELLGVNTLMKHPYLRDRSLRFRYRTENMSY